MKDLGAKIECDLKLVVFGENFFGKINNFYVTLSPKTKQVSRKFNSRVYYFGDKNKYKATLKLERIDEKNPKLEKAVEDCNE